MVEVPCVMYSDYYLKRDLITWGMFRGKPHKFLSHIMQSWNVKYSLQKSLELTLKKKLPMTSPHDLKFGQGRMKKPVKKGVCLCDPVLRGDPDGTAGCTSFWGHF